ncbi:hypothetical protein T484DRAFT_1837169 [Baffinella frigidus]|nr:hypothetical protein T484DRAFT_1837169 [Cryptophyta sp. CCMP2293]
MGLVLDWRQPVPTDLQHVDRSSIVTASGNRYAPGGSTTGEWKMLEAVLMDEALFDVHSRKQASLFESSGGGPQSPSSPATPRAQHQLLHNGGSGTPRTPRTPRAPLVPPRGPGADFAGALYLSEQDASAAFAAMAQRALHPSGQDASAAFAAMAQDGRKWARRLTHADFQQCLWTLGRNTVESQAARTASQEGVKFFDNKSPATRDTAGGNRQVSADTTNTRTADGSSVGGGGGILKLDLGWVGGSPRTRMGLASGSPGSWLSPRLMTATVATVQNKLSTPGPGHYYTGPAGNTARTAPWGTADRVMRIVPPKEGRPDVEKPWGVHAFITGSGMAKPPEATFGKAPRRLDVSHMGGALACELLTGRSLLTSDDCALACELLTGRGRGRADEQTESPRSRGGAEQEPWLSREYLARAHELVARVVDRLEQRVGAEPVANLIITSNGDRVLHSEMKCSMEQKCVVEQK